MPRITTSVIQIIQLASAPKLFENMDNIIPTVGIVVFNNGRILLVCHKENAEHLTGVYGLPGGRINENENPRDAADRELTEETGLKSKPEDLKELPEIYTASIPRKDGSIKNFSFQVYLCKKYNGEVKISNNPEQTPEWIDINEIKKYNLLPNVERAVNDALKL